MRALRARDYDIGDEFLRDPEVTSGIEIAAFNPLNKEMGSCLVSRA